MKAEPVGLPHFTQGLLQQRQQISSGQTQGW
jgi:hypothetical protein